MTFKKISLKKFHKCFKSLQKYPQGICLHFFLENVKRFRTNEIV
jgi:hypothetical protein